MTELALHKGRVSRRFIRPAIIILLIFLGSRLAIWLVSLPHYVERVTTLTVPEVYSSSGDITISNAIVDERANSLGVSLHTYALITVASTVVVITVNWLIGGLILWRNPESWFALLTAFILMMIGSAPMREPLSVVERGDIFKEIGGTVWPFFFLWLYLFPNGRPEPRWTRWLAYGCTIIAAIVFIILWAADVANLSALEPAALSTLETIGLVPSLTLIGLALVSQLYRFLRVSNAVERQQTKWFLFGLTVLILFVAANAVLPGLALFAGALGDLSLAIIPVTVGIAILRYRLFDIDVIIRRTTSYAIITGLLALIYFGSIVVFERSLNPLIGKSDVAVVLSTLLIAALFLPIRRRVQDAIDRRFNRTRYNAEKTIEAFAATVRNETDLDALTAELLRVIQQTMEPESLSIWLREPFIQKSSKEPLDIAG
jgi:hypothetical protein